MHFRVDRSFGFLKTLDRVPVFKPHLQRKTFFTFKPGCENLALKTAKHVNKTEAFSLLVLPEYLAMTLLEVEPLVVSLPSTEALFVIANKQLFY
jgi:hypothetical protein